MVKIKYKEWLYQWLENYVKPSCKERTYQRYRIATEQHLIPALGDVLLLQMEPMTVQRFLTGELQNGNIRDGKGLSASTVNLLISVIQNSMKTAYEIGLVDSYTMNRLKRPKVKEKQVECFSVAEQKIIESAVIADKRSKMFGVLFCLYTGVRIGELLALEWDDVNFAAGEITVNKSCHDGKNENGAYRRITESPKTEYSVRVIPLPKQLMPYLKEAKKQNKSKYVVGDGEKIISVRSYQTSFELLLKKLGIPKKGFHSLRHTFATRALECGMDVKTLSEILGHKNATVTLNRYVHSMTEHKRKMMDQLGKML